MISACYLGERENFYHMMNDVFPEAQIWMVAYVRTTSTPLA